MTSVEPATRAADVRPEMVLPEMISTGVPALVAGAHPRRMNLFAVLLRKELADHLHGRRFVAGAIICMLLWP